MTMEDGPARTKTMRALWQMCVADLREQLYLQTWELNVATLRPVSWLDGTLTLAAPNARAAEICARRLDRPIVRTMSGLARRQVKVVYVYPYPHPSPLPGGEGTGEGTGERIGEGIGEGTGEGGGRLC